MFDYVHVVAKMVLLSYFHRLSETICFSMLSLSIVQHCQPINSNIVKYHMHVCWKVIIGKTREQKRQCADCLCWTLVYKTIIILTPKPDI